MSFLLILNEASSEIGGSAFSNQVRSLLYSIMSKTSIVAGSPYITKTNTIAISQVFQEENFWFLSFAVNLLWRVGLSLALSLAVICLYLYLFCF